MTTATRRLPDHGTPSRARGRHDHGIPRCPCKPCREAENRYNKRRRYLTASGQSIMTDATPTAQHLRDLFAAGAGWEQLSEAADCSKATISKLIHGEQKTIRRSRAERILAIQPQDAAHARPSVPAIGSARRIQALMAMGHYCKTIQAVSGVERTTIAVLVNGQADAILASTATKLAAAYKQMAFRAGTSVRNRNRAAREGWPNPLQWGDDIDDPDAQPDIDDTRADELAPKRDGYRNVEIKHLASFGITPAEIAARVGLEERDVSDRLKKWAKEARSKKSEAAA